MTTTQDNTPVIETTKQDKPMFGTGRYSNAMETLYIAMIERLGIEPAKAEKIARQAGSDAGAAQAKSVASFKVSKVTKDGKVSVKDMVEAVKGITATYPLSIAHAIQWLGDAGKHGISYGKTQWQLEPELQSWVDKLVVK